MAVFFIKLHGSKYILNAIRLTTLSFYCSKSYVRYFENVNHAVVRIDVQHLLVVIDTLELISNIIT